MANNCGNCKYREVEGYEEPCSSCRTTSGGTPTKWEQQHTPQTNADRIRAMSDEELAAFLTQVECDVEEYPFVQDWDKWLKQPVEGE